MNLHGIIDLLAIGALRSHNNGPVRRGLATAQPHENIAVLGVNLELLKTTAVSSLLDLDGFGLVIDLDRVELVGILDELDDSVGQVGNLRIYSPSRPRLHKQTLASSKLAGLLSNINKLRTALVTSRNRKGSEGVCTGDADSGELAAS